MSTERNSLNAIACRIAESWCPGQYAIRAGRGRDTFEVQMSGGIVFVPVDATQRELNLTKSWWRRATGGRPLENFGIAPSRILAMHVDDRVGAVAEALGNLSHLSGADRRKLLRAVNPNTGVSQATRLRQVALAVTYEIERMR